MTIDKPSLAALLAQSRKAKANGDDVKQSTRPFMLKDPKSIVKEIQKKKAPEPQVDEEEEYLKSLLSGEADDTDVVFEEPKEEKLDSKALLRKIMEGK